MLTINRSVVVGYALLCSASVFAADAVKGLDAPAALVPGKTLTALQKKAIKPTSLEIGTRIYHVLDSTSGSEPATTLADDHDLIGKSRNEVVVTDASPDVVNSLGGHLSAAPVSIKSYPHIKTVVLRFSKLSEAVDAMKALKQALPASASVSLPIKWAEPKVQ